ncbi:MAG: fused MFS/spermidine synthase [Rhodocyclales bacterium]|nr:fused MFS/spermidine synthase [Rhodocyclales bacterium]
MQTYLTLPSPFNPEDTIHLLEPADADRNAVLRQVLSGEYAKPFVIDDADTRSLHFSLSLIQSTMQRRNAWALELEYTQAMMSFWLFIPRPRRILMLGLGGGSLAKFCHRQLPASEVCVVEIDPHVIAFRDLFDVPADGERFQIIEADGAAQVAEAARTGARFDVVMMDAFDRYGLADSVSSAAFYRQVAEILSGRGVMVANLAGEKDARAEHLAMLGEAFDGRLLCINVPEGNDVVLAFANPAFEPRWRELANQAKELRKRSGLDFPKFVQWLERSQRHYWG